MSAKKVFISYSRANRDFAEKLVESLRSCEGAGVSGA
jgi:hypothetical protein